MEVCVRVPKQLYTYVRVCMCFKVSVYICMEVCACITRQTRSWPVQSTLCRCMELCVRVLKQLYTYVRVCMCFKAAACRCMEYGSACTCFKVSVYAYIYYIYGSVCITRQTRSWPVQSTVCKCMDVCTRSKATVYIRTCVYVLQSEIICIYMEVCVSV